MIKPCCDFVHLHVHSHYSLYDGMQTIDSLTKRAKELLFRGIALTDHGKVGGFPEFLKRCEPLKPPTDEKEKEGYNPVWANELKPIFGCEIYIINDINDKKSKVYHQTVLAKNLEGYVNLLRLSTLSHKQIIKKFTNEFPCLTFEDLFRHKEGLIICSGCPSSMLSSLITEDKIEEAKALAKRFKDELGDDYYLEVMDTGYEPQKKITETLIQFSKELDIKIVATNDVHYTNKKEADLQAIKISISRNGPLPADYKNMPEYYMKSFDEMNRLFNGEGTRFLLNTVEICEKVNKFKPKQSRLPDFDIPKDNLEYNEFKKNMWRRSDEEMYLSYLAHKGLKKFNLHTYPKYVERLENELETIKFTKFENYFLMVQDYCDFARREDISIGAGRGSGVGSLVLYCLEVIGLDPIEYGLDMDRFLFAKANYRAKPGAFFEEITDKELEMFSIKA